MPTIHILSTLWISCPHSIHILSTFCPHSIHIPYCARGMGCARRVGTGIARQREGWVFPSLCLLSVCVMLVGSKGVDVCCVGCCMRLWGRACAFHGLRMVVLACARPVLIGVCGWLWWLVGVLCHGCWCLCAPAAHGLEKIFAKCVDLWISTPYLCWAGNTSPLNLEDADGRMSHRRRSHCSWTSVHGSCHFSAWRPAHHHHVLRNWQGLPPACSC